MKGDAMSDEVRRGFTVFELFAVIGVCVLMIAIVLPLTSQRTCTNSQSVVAQANLRLLNTGAANFAADHADSIYSISEERQIEAALRRATNRVESQDFIIPDHVFLNLRYSHIVLLDYLTDRQPEPIAVSPFDKNLIHWQDDPLAYIDEDSNFPYADGLPSTEGYDMDPMWVEQSVKQLWPFGSSYQVVPHAWLDDVDPQYTPSAESPHHLVKGELEKALGGRRMSEVAHPSAKVFLYEEFDRFSDSDGIYAAYPTARINMAFFDGSVRQEVVGDSNSAFDAEYPDAVWEQRYVPLDTFPVPMSGLGELKKLDMRFRWTKGGLSGVDYN
jgi:prepilin-type processing-associated H-X9-DG protein